MADTVIDALEKVFGDELGPDLIHAALSCTPDTLASVECLRRASARVLPIKDRAHLRPFISSCGAAHVNITLGRELFQTGVFNHPSATQPPDWEKVTRYETIIKHHLLYCHSIALEDPSDVVFYPFMHGLDGIVERGRLQQWLTVLLTIKTLVQKGIVVFVDEGNIFAEWHQSPSGHGRTLYSTDRWPPRVLYDTEMSVPDEFIGNVQEWAVENRRMHILDSAADALGLQLFAEQCYGEEKLDFYLGTRVAAEVLDSALTCGRVEQGFLREIVTSTVPDLQGLSLDDIIRIRDEEGAFAEFRTFLSDSLSHALAVQSAVIPGELQRFLETRAREKCKEIERTVRESSLLSRSKNGFLGVTVAAMSAILGAETWAAALLGAGSAVLGKLADDFAATVGDSSSRDILMRHCLVYERTNRTKNQ